MFKLLDKLDHEGTLITLDFNTILFCVESLKRGQMLRASLNKFLFSSLCAHGLRLKVTLRSLHQPVYPIFSRWSKNASKKCLS